VTAESREFAARRERLAVRARIGDLSAAPPAGLTDGFLDGDRNAVDVDLGNFAALLTGRTLWVSATLLVTGESRASAVASALAWIVRRKDGAVRRLAVFDAVQPGATARILAQTTLSTAVFDVRGAPSGSGSLAMQTPHQPALAPKPADLSLAELFREAGAEVVVEHGVVAAEVAGLEVARVVDEDGVARVRIGVGVHDRETFRMLHGETATVEQLREVVRIVAAHRSAGAATHPLNLLAPERALRQRVVRDPAIIGLSSLKAVEPPTPRTNLKDSVPCCATGVDAKGREVVAVFVAGVDLDAVPFAVDARLRHAPNARLVIVAESRNVVPLQREIAALFLSPAEFVSA
jgi:hypothetical protein